MIHLSPVIYNKWREFNKLAETASGCGFFNTACKVGAKSSKQAIRLHTELYTQLRGSPLNNNRSKLRNDSK